MTHDQVPSTHQHNTLEQLSQESDAKSATDASPQVTGFTYATAGQVGTSVKPNGNTVTSTYYADELPYTMTEKTSGGTLVSSHQYAYDPWILAASLRSVETWQEDREELRDPGAQFLSFRAGRSLRALRFIDQGRPHQAPPCPHRTVGDVPAGTRLQSSSAAPAFGQPGGMLQFELLERIPKLRREGVPFG